jgi:MinD-like ATPase involved in chromosome partitioning or flagellar assembly
MIGKSGKIITFYSYKGGTGRSMAVSNVAWILASNGYDVLIIDWDLEAPGLHRYLRAFLVDPELTSSPGVIDFVWDAARVNVTPADKSQATSLAAEFPSLEDYVIGLNWDFHDNGSISFIPAGRQDENYAQRVNTFSWDNFYERLSGGKLLQAKIDGLRKSYDFILIDSRTGVSDTSGICTVQLPDMLAVFFTLNRQSIKGAAAVALSVRAQREIPIYPVPTRIENGEQVKLKLATAYARHKFAPFLLHVQSDRSKIVLEEQAAYWHEVETPYISFYAFEEVPAAFMEERGSLRGILAPTERLAARLSDQRVTALKSETDELRKRVVAAYEFREDEEQARKVAWDAAAAPRSGVGTVFASVGRDLARRLWQYTTVAGTVAVVGLTALWLIDARRIADLSSQLARFSAELSQLSSKVNTTAQFLQAAPNLSEVYGQLKEIEGSLSALRSTVQVPPERVGQELSQLSSKVNTTAQFLQGAPNLSEVYGQLKEIEGSLNALRSTVQVPPGRVGQVPQKQQNQ